MTGDTKGKPLENLDCSSDAQSLCTLVLFNDDINEYDFVVKSLVDVCKHKWEQAEQCTLIAHHKGKCDIKSGSLMQLRPMREELTKRGLSSVIVEN